VTQVHDDQTQTERSRIADLLVGGLYLVIIGANAWLAYDWWRETPQGEATIERLAARIEAVKVKAQECEGCAHRKAKLKAAMNRMHWQAERIVEGEDVETVPEA
jgi:hypothetical protein